MTPRDVDQMEPAELAAFWKYLEDEVRAQQREARAARRKR
jgi:hypothetical protein